MLLYEQTYSGDTVLATWHLILLVGDTVLAAWHLILLVGEIRLCKILSYMRRPYVNLLFIYLSVFYETDNVGTVANYFVHCKIP